MKKILLKRFIVIIAIGINAYSLHGQTYNPMLSDSCEWYLIKCFEDCDTDLFDILGDTLINDKKYFKYFKAGYYQFGYLREDTTQKKVYFKGNHKYFKNDDSEIVLYDYSLNLADTFLWIIPDYRGKLDTIGYLKVTEISTKNYDVGERKVISLFKEMGSTPQAQLELIESFGLSIGFDTFERSFLNCFYRKNVKEFEGETAKETKNCVYSYHVNVKEAKNNKKLIIMQEFDKWKIKIADFNGAPCILKIYNINGSIIFQSTIYNEETILNTSYLPQGIYLISLTSKDKIINRKLFLSNPR